MLFKIPSKAFQMECSLLYEEVDKEVEKLEKYVNQINQKIIELQNSTILTN